MKSYYIFIEKLTTIYYDLKYNAKKEVFKLINNKFLLFFDLEIVKGYSFPIQVFN
jgi:hypothetical protein